MTFLWNNPLLKQLTRREIAVLKQVFSGLTSKQIAKELSISPRTVEVHRSNILRKLHVTSTPQLADVVLKSIAQLEGMLAESEAHLKEAQQIAQVGSWKWNITTDTHFWSDEMYRIFGFEDKTVEFSLAVFLNALIPDDLERVKYALNQSLHHNLPYNIEYRIRVKGNIIKEIHAIGIVHRDATGKAISMTGTLQDISERKSLERQVDMTRQKSESLYQQAPAGFHSLNQNGEFIDINQTELDWLGYEKAEILGKKLTDLMPLESKELFQANSLAILNEVCSQGIEYDLLCKDGGMCHVLMHCKAICDENDHFLESRAVMFKIDPAKT